MSVFKDFILHWKVLTFFLEKNLLSYSSGRKCTIHNNSPVIRLESLTYTAIHTTVIRKMLHIPFTENIVKSPLISEIRIKTPSVNIFMTIERIHHVKNKSLQNLSNLRPFSLVRSGSWLLPTNYHLSGSQSQPTVALKSPPIISLKLGCSNLIVLMAFERVL